MLKLINTVDIPNVLCANTEPFLNQVGSARALDGAILDLWGDAPGEYVLENEYGQLWEREFFARTPAPMAGACQESFRPFADYGFLQLPFRTAPRLHRESGAAVLSTLNRLQELATKVYPNRTIVLRGQTREYQLPRSSEERVRLFGRPDVHEPSLHPSEARRDPISRVALAVWCQLVQEHFARIRGYHPIHRGITSNEITPFATNGPALTLAFAQHYGLPTPALDVTRDPLVALWFATNEMTTQHNRTEVRPASGREGVIYVIAAVPGQYFDAELTGDAAIRPLRQRGGFMASNWGNSKNRAARYIAAAVYFPVEIREELASSLPSTEELFPGPPEDEFVSTVQALARGQRVRSDAVDEIIAHLYWVGDDGWQGIIVPSEGLWPRPSDSSIARGDDSRSPIWDGQMRPLTASDAAEELSVLTTAADSGNVEATYRLGWLLSQRGEARGRELLLSAALAGHPDAINDVGLNFARTGDAVEAEKWYQRGARMGHVLCAYNLASLLLAAGNLKEAKFWFEVSAKGGDLDGATNLGALLFQEGKHDEAVDWLKLGAAGGNAQAAYNLGVYFVTKKRQDEALRWFDLAAQLGDVDAWHESAKLRAANPQSG